MGRDRDNRLDVHPVAVVLVLLLTLAPSSFYGVVQSAFAAKNTSATSTFTAATLVPPATFSHSRPCLPIRASTTAMSSTTSITVPTPTAAVGDYLIMSVHHWNANGTPPTLNPPTGGWTTLYNQTFVPPVFATHPTNHRLAIFYLVVTSLPLPANYTMSWAIPYAMEVTLSSFTGITGLEASAIGTGTTSPAIAPTVTAAGTKRRLLTVVGHTGITAPTPTGQTAGPFVNGYNNLAGLHTYHELLVASGATGTRSTPIGKGAGPATDISWMAASVLMTTSPTAITSTPLSWPITASAAADGYEIIRDGGSPTFVSGRSTLTWTDTTTYSTTAYNYTITATGGTWRSASRSVSVGPC